MVDLRKRRAAGIGPEGGYARQPCVSKTEKGSDMNLCAKNLVIASVSICAAFVSFGAQAEGAATQSDTHLYADLSYARLTLDSSGYSVTPSDAIVRVGYDFTKNFSVELVGATSVASANVNILGYDVALKVDNGYGAYLKGRVEVAPNFELFAKAGWVHATISASVPGVAASSSDSSASYGVGLHYMFAKPWYLQADYVSYYSKSGDTIKGPSIGVGVRF